MTGPVPAGLRPFLLTRFLLEVQLWFPVWLIFLTDRGLSVSQASAADGLFRLTLVILLVPAGMLADRVGRRRMYLANALATIVVHLAITQVTTMSTLVAVWMVWGAQWALREVVAAPYLHALVHRSDRDADAWRTRAFGLDRAVTSVAVLCSHLAAGPLHELSSEAPYVATAGLASLAMLLAPTLPRVPAPAPSARRRGVRATMVTAFGDPARRPPLAWLTTLIVIGWSVRILFQPLTIQLDLSPSATGLMYFGYSGAAGVAGLVMPQVVRRLGPGCTVAISVGGVVTAVGCAWAFPDLAPVLFIPLLGSAFTLGEALLIGQVTAASPTTSRATVLAGVGITSGLVVALSRPALGTLADRTSATTAFGIWALTAGVVLVPFARRASRVRPSARR